MRVKITSSPEKHSMGLPQTHIGPWEIFQRIMVSQRQGHYVCLWATHLPNTVKPEQWVIQTENIKTLTRSSPKGLLQPRQWTQFTELRGLSCFCSAPDLSQGERFGTKQVSSVALGRPLGPWTTLLSLTALPWARGFITVWMVAMVYDFLVQVFVAFHLMFWFVWLPSPSFFSCYIILFLTPLLQSPSLSHSFFLSQFLSSHFTLLSDY